MTFPIVGSKCAPGILDERAAVVPGAVSLSVNESDFVRIFRRQRMMLGARPEFHHVPGRLRFRAEELKQDPAKLEALSGELAGVPGVRSATANRHTGSIIVFYDPQVLSPEAISAALQEHQPEIADGGLCSWGEQLGTKVIEWLLEKAAVALIAAMV